MKRIVVLSGAGISAESGLKTFRDAGGLWEGHEVSQVATPEAFQRDPELVLRFYNERRRQALAAQPNSAHLALVELEAHYEVHIITQNVDDLHERAGSSSVLHLHGELLKARSVARESLIIPCEGDLALGQCGEDGQQLRPHVVWFGEAVPMIVPAAALMQEADIVLIVGTSLVVYPAAGLINYAPPKVPIFVIDPRRPTVNSTHPIEFYEEPGSTGVPKVVARLIEAAQAE